MNYITTNTTKLTEKLYNLDQLVHRFDNRWRSLPDTREEKLDMLRQIFKVNSHETVINLLLMPHVKDQLLYHYIDIEVEHKEGHVRESNDSKYLGKAPAKVYMKIAERTYRHIREDLLPDN